MKEISHGIDMNELFLKSGFLKLHTWTEFDGLTHYDLA